MDKILTLTGGKKGPYRVSKKLGGTDKFTMYLCHKDGEEKCLILKIATKTAFNGLLDREAFILAARSGQNSTPSRRPVGC